jgi:hypothetical protein
MRRGVMRRFEGLSYREWEDVRMLAIIRKTVHWAEMPQQTCAGIFGALCVPRFVPQRFIYKGDYSTASFPSSRSREVLVPVLKKTVAAMLSAASLLTTYTTPTSASTESMRSRESTPARTVRTAASLSLAQPSSFTSAGA